MTTPTPPNDRARAPMRGWLKILLFASLALNLAVAGMAIGAFVRHGAPAGPHPVRVDQMGGPYTGALTREDRRAIWRELREMQGDSRVPRAQNRADFEAVVAALRQTPYDAALVREIVERQFHAGMERQQIGQSLLLKRIDEMSAAERAGFADRLAEALERRRGGQHPAPRGGEAGGRD